MDVDLDALYAVLVGWIVGGTAHYRPYAQLSEDYAARTGHHFDPHLSWDAPLGALNQRLSRVGAPALSALVVLKASMRESPEPGGGFWGSADTVPSRPRNAMARLATWSRIVGEVERYDWPDSLSALMQRVPPDRQA